MAGRACHVVGSTTQVGLTQALGDRIMINRTDNPVGWSLLLSDLDDAHEHLGNLIKEISTDAEYGEPELRIDLGNVYAHLNRAWRRRLIAAYFSAVEWEARSEVHTSELQSLMPI